MPDTPVASQDGPPYDPAVELRVSRLEDDVRDVRSALGRLEATTLKIETMLVATLPHLATKADVADLRTELKYELATRLADKPGKTYMWGILAALLTAYACGLAGIAFLK
jgi:hypothetical protein